MATTTPAPQEIDTTFTAPMLLNDAVGGWTTIVMPDSGTFFGTRKPVKVAGTMDGHAFQATMLPIGDGTHILPVKAALRKALGKSHGDEVTVHLLQRFS